MRGAGSTRLAIALLACAIAARPFAVSIGPLLPDIQAELGMGNLLSGFMGMVTVICLGVFAPTGVQLAAALRPRRVLGVALALIVTFGAARALVPNVATLIVPVAEATGGGARARWRCPSLSWPRASSATSCSALTLRPGPSGVGRWRCRGAAVWPGSSRSSSASSP